MIITDYHVHSDTSADNKMKLRELYEAAAAKGIKHICVTNHYEMNEVKAGEYKQSMTEEELAAYREEVRELQKDGRVDIAFGIEMGYTEAEEEDIRAFLERNEFDFVLGSVHHSGGHEVAVKDMNKKLKGKIDQKECRDEYFRVLKEGIKSRLFDVMSHLDIYIRAYEEASFSEAKHHWEDIADLLIENDVGFEINTCKPLLFGEGTHPSQEVIEYLVKRGVKLITVGSDAHKPEQVGQGLEDAVGFLKSLGVKYIYRYEKRRPIPEPI